MTQSEAHEKANRLSKHVGLWPTVTRILPSWQDPIIPGDDGWDVIVSVTVADIQSQDEVE